MNVSGIFLQTVYQGEMNLIGFFYSNQPIKLICSET